MTARRRIVLDFSAPAVEEPVTRRAVPRAAARPAVPRTAARPAGARPEIAPLGARFAASFIDSLVVSVIAGVVLAILVSVLGAAIASTATDAASAGAAIGLLFLLWLFFGIAGAAAAGIYGAALLARAGDHNGQTLGKQAMGLRVVPVGGGEMTSGIAVARELLWRQLVFNLLSVLLLWIPTLLDVAWALWDPERRTLHDKGAGTIVVRA